MNSAVSDDSLQKSSADEDSIAALQDAIASTQRAIASARDKHVRQALLDSAESLAKHLSDARLSSRSGDSSLAKPKPMQTATNRQTGSHLQGNRIPHPRHPYKQYWENVGEDE